jgi:hypothetical protein
MEQKNQIRSQRRAARRLACELLRAYHHIRLLANIDLQIHKILARGGSWARNKPQPKTQHVIINKTDTVKTPYHVNWSTTLRVVTRGRARLEPRDARANYQPVVWGLEFHMWLIKSPRGGRRRARVSSCG